MSDKQIRTLILLGLAGAAVWYLVKNATPYVPQMVNITPINPGLLPSGPASGPSPTSTAFIQPGMFAVGLSPWSA